MTGLREKRPVAQDTAPVTAAMPLPTPGKRTLLARSLAKERADARRVGKRTRVWLEACRGGGRPLAAQLRGRLERALGRDLAGLTIHDDAAADAAARDVHARAFTVGQDIFFARGEYRPHEPDGQELIAHEVAHAVQQRGSQVGDELELSRPGDSVEHEADSFAAAFARIPPEERLIQPAGRGPELVAPVAPLLVMPAPLVSTPGTISRALIARRPPVGHSDPDRDTPPAPGPQPPSGLFEYYPADFELAPKKDIELFKQEFTQGTHVSLLDTTVPVSGVPVNIDAGFSVTPATALAKASYGPLRMSNMKVVGGLITPLFPTYDDMALTGKGTLSCVMAAFDGEAKVTAEPKIALGAVAGIFKLEGGVTLAASASFKAKVVSRLDQEVDIASHDGVNVSLGTLLKLSATASASLRVTAGVYLELSLNLPRLPILDKLNTALGGWPSRILKFIGLGDSGKLWSKRWTADWTAIETTASRQTEGKLSLNVTKGEDGAATVGEVGSERPLDLSEALASLSGKKPDSDDLPKEEEEEPDNKPSALAGARARASSAVKGARAAIAREKASNQDSRSRFEALHPHGTGVRRGGMGPASEPSAVEADAKQLDDNDSDIKELGEGAQALEDAIGALQAGEGQPAQGPQIKKAYDNVAINAHNLEGEAVEIQQPDVEGDDGGGEDKAAEQARGHARGALDEVKAVLDTERDWARARIREHAATREPEIRTYVSFLGDHEDIVEQLRAEEWRPLDSRLTALGKTGSVSDYEAVRNEAVELRDELATLVARPAEPEYNQAYVELKNGKFELKEPYRSDIRKEFYEREGYGPNVLAWKERELSTPRSAGGLRHETEPDLWWYQHGGGGGWWHRSEATIAHESPTCAAHWNDTGRASGQADRTDFYRGGSDFEHKLFLQPGRINSGEGGRRLDGTYKKDVAGSWSPD